MNAPHALRETAAGRLIAGAPHVVVAVVCALFIQTGWQGIDFGKHWDEHHHVESARRTVATGMLLPKDYWHPSATYLLTMACAAPELVDKALGRPINLKAALGAETWPLRVRRVGVVVTAFALLWVHLLLCRWRGGGVARAWEGALAAALLGTSWQLAFHARWIAADAMMVSFASLSTLCLVLSRDERLPRRGLFWAGVVAAGVCTASKYTTGLLLLPCLLTAWAWQPGEARRVVVERMALTVLVFVVTYLAITPGMIIEAPRFFRRLKMQATIYGAAGHRGYTIGSHVDYVVAMVRYLFGGFFSSSPPIAVALSLLVPAGLVRLWRERKTRDSIQVVVVLLFSGLYVAFFATQKAFIVRNFLVVTPTLAILAALGAGWIVPALWRRAWPAAVAVVLAIAGAVVVDARFLMTAAESIEDRRSDRFVRDLVAWLDRHPDEGVVASSRVRAAVAALDTRTGGSHGARLAAAPTATTTLLVTYAAEALHSTKWPANDPGLTVAVFGPLEVDFNLYPTWRGDDRIVVLTLARARAIGAAMPAATPAPDAPVDVAVDAAVDAAVDTDPEVDVGPGADSGADAAGP